MTIPIVLLQYKTIGNEENNRNTQNFDDKDKISTGMDRYP